MAIANWSRVHVINDVCASPFELLSGGSVITEPELSITQT